MRRHLLVGVPQTGDEIRMRDTRHQCVDAFVGQGVFRPFKAEAALFQFRTQECVQHHGTLLAASQGQRLGRWQKPPAQRAKQRQSGEFGAVFFLKFWAGRHDFTILCLKFLDRPLPDACR